MANKADIKGIDPVSVMLETHRHFRGTTTGMEFAREAHTFMRTHRFSPPLDETDVALLRHLYTTHLIETTRFTGSCAEWLQSRNDPAQILALAERIPWEDYVDSLLVKTRTRFVMLKHEITDTIVPQLEKIRDLDGEQKLGLSSKLQNMSRAIKLECTMSKRRLDGARKQEGLPPELAHELSFVVHDMKNWAGYASSDLQVLPGKIGELLSYDYTEEALASKKAREIAEIAEWVRETCETMSFTDISSIPALEFVVKHFDNRGGRVRVVGDKATPEGVDNENLRRGLSLLVMNALDFPRKGAPLEVTITATPTSIDIADNGRGMTEARLGEVQNALQTGKPLKSDHGGSGLGLINAAHFLKPATLKINSQPGMGSTFSIRYR